jgi:N-acetylmuramic acid 6-phosphate etherase
MLTEQQNPKTRNLDQMETSEILSTINDEDKQVAFAVEKALPAIAQAVDTIVEQLRQGGRLFYVGAGTSGRLGVLDAVECVPTFSTPPELVQGLIAGGEKAFMRAVEGAEDRPDLGEADLVERSLSAKDVVVAIAASGRTPYAIGAVLYAKSIGAKTIAVACNVPSALLEEADIAIGIPVGAEVLTGSTRMKAGTAQKMVLNMLSTASMVKLGKVYGNLMVDVQITNAKLEKRAQGILMQIADVDEATAIKLLKETQGNVKTAIVMHFKQVAYLEAKQLLEDAEGNLRQIIG